MKGHRAMTVLKKALSHVLFIKCHNDKEIREITEIAFDQSNQTRRRLARERGDEVLKT